MELSNIQNLIKISLNDIDDINKIKPIYAYKIVRKIGNRYAPFYNNQISSYRRGLSTIYEPNEQGIINNDDNLSFSFAHLKEDSLEEGVHGVYGVSSLETAGGIYYFKKDLENAMYECDSDSTEAELAIIKCQLFGIIIFAGREIGAQQFKIIEEIKPEKPIKRPKSLYNVGDIVKFISEEKILKLLEEKKIEKRELHFSDEKDRIRYDATSLLDKIGNERNGGGGIYEETIRQMANEEFRISTVCWNYNPYVIHENRPFEITGYNMVNIKKYCEGSICTGVLSWMIEPVQKKKKSLF